jgi:lipopolysaccharide export system protein LptC
MSPLATVSAIDGRRVHAFSIRAREDGDRLFRAARRHSRFVRALRVILPAGSVTVLAVLVLIAWFTPLRTLSKIPGQFDSVVVSGTKIMMEQPRLSGFTRDARGYQMTARSAAQDLTKPDLVELEGIRAKVEMQDSGPIEITAATGVYDTKNELLRLNRDIVLTTASGYEGQFSEADVDIRKGRVVSEKPVFLKLTNGKLNANRMEMLNNGEVVIFDGGVVMTLDDVGEAGGQGAKAP